MIEKPRSVYTRGAEDGLILGPVLSLTIVLAGVTTYHAWAFLPALAAIVFVPVITYVLLRRSFAEDNGTSSLSALWLHGICIFFFGGLIMALVSYIAMRWICPSFIADQFRTVIDTYSSLEQADARQFADTLQKAVDSRALPTPIEVSLELLYATVFSGSVLSVILAMFVRRRGQAAPPSFPR